LTQTEWDQARASLENDLATADQTLSQAQASAAEAGSSGTALEAELAQSRVALGESETKLRETEERMNLTQTEWDQARASLENDLATADQTLSQAQAAATDQTDSTALIAARLSETQTALKMAEDAHERTTSSIESEKQILADEIDKLKTAVRESESRIDPGELDAIRDELLSKLSDSERGREAIREKHEAAATAWDDQRQQLETGLTEARRESSEKADGIENEIREKLTLDYEFKLKELTFQKDQLEQKVSDAEATAHQATTTEGTPSGGDTDGVDSQAMLAEIATVDQQIIEVTAFIDDPNSSLPAVIRKNVERSELEAYKRGLSYRVPAIEKTKS
jgi:chromosome segregation ATPase